VSRQSLAALSVANSVRFQRADDKRRVRAATPADSYRVVRDLLLTHPPHLNSLLVLELLQWPKRMGTARAERLLYGHGIGYGRRVVHLTENQRRRLAYDLEIIADGMDSLHRRRAA
jgi:hypothetical protein